MAYIIATLPGIYLLNIELPIAEKHILYEVLMPWDPKIILSTSEYVRKPKIKNNKESKKLIFKLNFEKSKESNLSRYIKANKMDA